MNDHEEALLEHTAQAVKRILDPVGSRGAMPVPAVDLGVQTVGMGTAPVVSVRYRVTVSRGMRGAVSFEATTDITGMSMDEVLARSDALVAELSDRYPVVT